MTMIDEWTKLLNLSEWLDGTPKNASGKLKSSKTPRQFLLHLRSVTTAVYVMQSTIDPTIFRAGAFGYRKTNALVRLKSVNSDPKWKKDPQKYSPFEYIFLAPLPDDLGHKLEEAETNYLHADITHFLRIQSPGKNPFKIKRIPDPKKPSKRLQRRQQKIS